MEGFSPELAAVVEIDSSQKGRLPVGRIRQAYRASRRGTVALVLNGVSPAQVDRALDPIVREVRGVAGVVYCTRATLTPLLRRPGQSSVAWLGSKELAGELAKAGVVVSPVPGRNPLRDWSRGRAARGRV
jgi:hypothetical protein